MISSQFQILVISNEGFIEHIILGDHSEHSCLTFSTIITAEIKERGKQTMSKSHKASSTTTARAVLSANRLEYTLGVEGGCYNTLVGAQ